MNPAKGRKTPQFYCIFYCFLRSLCGSLVKRTCYDLAKVCYDLTPLIFFSNFLPWKNPSHGLKPWPWGMFHDSGGLTTLRLLWGSALWSRIDLISLKSERFFRVVGCNFAEAPMHAWTYHSSGSLADAIYALILVSQSVSEPWMKLEFWLHKFISWCASDGTFSPARYNLWVIERVAVNRDSEIVFKDPRVLDSQVFQASPPMVVNRARISRSGVEGSYFFDDLSWKAHGWPKGISKCLSNILWRKKRRTRMNADLLSLVPTEHRS